MTKKAVMIIAPEKFRDEELFEPKDILESKGVDVTVASKSTGVITGMLGGSITVTTRNDEISANDYDAIIFVGGSGASVYFEDETILTLAKNFFNKGKIVAAICIAPSILANAGLLNEKKATAFHSESTNLRAKGAYYSNEDLVISGRIITAKGPQAAKAFGTAVTRALGIIFQEKI